ncbi:MAG: hypothetical protein V4723_05670 [Pseudomonadota bacterium]
MMEKLIQMRDTIDAKPVRERVAIFATVAALIVYAVYTVMLSPLFSQQALLRAQINQQNNNMIGIDGEMTATVLAYQRDPDQVARARLSAVQAETTALRTTMMSKQANLVAPTDMVPVLENLLRGNTRLRLMTLDSMPAQPIRSKAAGASADAVDPLGDAIYQHGVELTVSGNYLDMIDYMRALEGMPTRLFWGKAALQVEEYPNSRLTLTLYTLSLDKKWMTL